MSVEVWEQVVSLLEADSQLITLLGGEKRIYWRRPTKERKLPCVAYYGDESPDLEMDTHGKFELRLYIDIWSLSAETNDQIKDRLDAVLFDKRMSTTNYSVKGCRRLTALPIPTGVVDESGKEIEQLSTTWRLKVFKKGV